MNAIQKLQSGAVELSDIERMILEESAQDDAAFDFVAQRFKMPTGGGLFFTLDDEPVKQFTAVVALSQKARAWWPGEGLGKPPLCSSHDGHTGWLPLEMDPAQVKEADKLEVTHPALKYADDGGERGPFECARCPLSMWGSAPKAKSDHGQACKTLRRLVLLVDGYNTPILFTLPPSSVKVWDSYCSRLASKRSAYFAVRTSFSLVKETNSRGTDYAVIDPMMIEAIDTPEQFAAVQHIRNEYRSLIGRLDITAAEYETEDSRLADAERDTAPMRESAEPEYDEHGEALFAK